MPTGSAHKLAGKSRRRFLIAAGAAGAASLGMPQVSRAQTAVWKIQSAWPPRDVFHEFALDYAKRVETMTAGRLRLDVVFGGSVVPPFQAADAVHAGIIDGAHGSADLWYNKHKACSLFGAPPSFGWDSHGFLAWFYAGGGEALYKELYNVVLRLDVVGFLCVPMPGRPLGWFRKEIAGGEGFKGLRFRTGGLTGEVFRALGIDSTPLPGAELAAALDRGLLDGADAANPATDLLLGLPDVAKVYMLGGHHRPVEALEIIFNKRRFDAQPAEIKAILRHAAFSASSEQLWSTYVRYVKDMDEIAKRGVKVTRTSPKLLEDLLKAWDAVLAERSKERFFAQVVAAQKAWVKRTGPYLRAANLDSAALDAAYRHYFG